MRVVVLGGIGYLGGRLTAYLRARGHHVRVTTRRPLDAVPSWLSADEVVQSDLIGEQSLRAALSDRDVVIHLAGPDEIAAAADPDAALRAGEELTGHTLTTLAACRPRPLFLYLSTFHVYGRNGVGLVHEEVTPLPQHPYALGRYAGELVTQRYRREQGVDALCVRLSNAFGAPASCDVPRWSLLFNDLCRQAVSHRALVLKSRGRQRRNFVTLGDTVRALEFLFLHPRQWPGDGVIHLGSTMNLSVRQAAERVARVAGEVLGVTLPIVVPESDEVAAEPVTLDYSVARLSAMGFEWTNEVDAEIRATLALVN